MFSSPSAKRTIESLPWSNYFTSELYLEKSAPDEKVVHHVYLTTPASKGPLFVTHHGAGSSGLSFALFASEVRKILPDAGVLALDARGHGETTVQKPRHDNAVSPEADIIDLSLGTLSSDLVTSIQMTQAKMGWKEPPGLILVGHSLGGAVVTNVARKGVLGDRVLGYAVLDIVEGKHVHHLFSKPIWLNPSLAQPQQSTHCRPCRLTSRLVQLASHRWLLVLNGSKLYLIHPSTPNLCHMNRSG